MNLISYFIRYWWLYGVNFFIYLATSSRIREAYRQFITDMWKKLFLKPDANLRDIYTETTIFWIGLRYLEQHDLHGNVRENVKC